MAILLQLIFSYLRQNSEILGFEVIGDEEVVDYKKLFLASSSLVKSDTIITQALIKKLSKVFSTFHEDVDVQRPMHYRFIGRSIYPTQVFRMTDSTVVFPGWSQKTCAFRSFGSIDL